MFLHENGRLVFAYDAERLWIEPWGQNSLRVRATKASSMPTEDWALLQPKPTKSDVDITDECATLVNGRISATVTQRGKVTVRDDSGKVLLEEFARNRRELTDPKCSALEIEAREFKPIIGGEYHLTARFESLDPKEKIYGMGQYQQPYLDIKGTQIELAHRNSQASVPFALSSRGYGFLWNNPSIGTAIFGKNIMSFEARSTTVLDYWIVAGETPAQIIEAYAEATGKVPMMPEYGLGFWQCKLRYQTQDELLNVAREYKRLQLPIDLIVIDFFVSCRRLKPHSERVLTRFSTGRNRVIGALMRRIGQIQTPWSRSCKIWASSSWSPSGQQSIESPRTTTRCWRKVCSFAQSVVSASL